jgi:site-specific DNA-methyltransferase (adenine-specific)
LEPTFGEYIDRLVAVFRQAARVMRPDGTLWLNMGDKYNADKNLIGLPWRIAFALQADGWILRSDIVWHKTNPMPESVTDRPTRAHEYIFLFSRQPKYYYDAAAIRTPEKKESLARYKNNHAPVGSRGLPGGNAQNIHKIFGGKQDKQRGHSRRHAGFNDRWDTMTKEQKQSNGANKRDVWTMPTAGYKGAHFATFPLKLIEPCILAGSRPGDTVLDPFAGTGTTCAVALSHGRRAVGIEISEKYCGMALDRCGQTVITMTEEPNENPVHPDI